MTDDTPEATWDDETRWEPSPEPTFREKFPTLQALIDSLRPIAVVYGLREEVPFPWRME